MRREGKVSFELRASKSKSEQQREQKRTVGPSTSFG